VELSLSSADKGTKTEFSRKDSSRSMAGFEVLQTVWLQPSSPPRQAVQALGPGPWEVVTMVTGRKRPSA
jgi:hypothetical protein